jgi:glycerol kinase
VTDLTQVTTSATSAHQQHVTTTSSNKSRASLLSQKSLQFDDPIASNHEIERIIAKIQQDNKILAELDKNAGESY